MLGIYYHKFRTYFYTSDEKPVKWAADIMAHGVKRYLTKVKV